MARNEFETEVGDYLRKYFRVVHRIPDRAFNRDGGRSVSKSPFDFFGCDHGGHIFGAEAKRVKVKRFPFNLLKPHQFDALKDVANAGGHSFIFINFRVQEPGLRCGRAFCIPFFDYNDIIIERGKANRKSFRAEHIPAGCELKRVTGGWER